MKHSRLHCSVSRLVLFLLLAAAPLLFTGCGWQATPSPTTDATNEAAQINASTNNPTNAATSAAATLQGRVFLKGYKTPSESYGILTAEGLEIGMGKYDAMREQLRPYIGEDISVTFTKICKSGSTDCCRSLFTHCGIVQEWTPSAATR